MHLTREKDYRVIKSDEILFQGDNNDKVNVNMKETGVRHEQTLVSLTILETKFLRRGKNHAKSDKNQILGLVYF